MKLLNTDKYNLAWFYNSLIEWSNMTPSNDENLTIGVQRPGAVDNIDIGPLVSDLTVEPWELVQDVDDSHHIDGSIEISVQRSHEWEYLIAIGIAGGGTFAAAVIKALGHRVGDWIADQVSTSSRGDQDIKISTESGTSMEIPIDQIEESTDEIIIILEDASRDQEKVVIEIP